MKSHYLKILAVVLALTLLALLTATSVAAYPDKGAVNVAQPKTVASLSIFKQAKFREHLRVPREDQILRMLQKEKILPPNASPDAVNAAIEEFMREWARRNPTIPNPKRFKQLLENEQRALAAGKSPKALGLAVDDGTFQTLVVAVEFPGTDTFTYSATDPETGECIDVEVTTSGPLHNQIVLGPRDNNTFWYEDFTPETYDELYFGTGPDAGLIVHHPNLGELDLRGLTVANYYLEQSEGAFALSGYVYPRWLQAAHSEGWYGADSCETGSVAVRAGDLVRETVDLINADNPDFPWQDFDGDGDGYVDNYTVIHAGLGQEAGGGEQGDFAIWSHASSVWPPKLACSAGSPGCPDRDIYVGPYSMDPENFDIGVGAEEFGHAFFGLPDLYTTDYTNSISNWAIMSAGSWNGPLGGMQPAPFPGWFRWLIGWWDPVEVNYDDPDLEVTIGQLSQRPEGTEYGMKINLPPREEFIPNLAGEGKGWKTDIPDLSFAYAWRFFDLSAATPPVIFSFNAYYEIEELWDYGFFEVSTDGGATWTPIPDMDGVTTDENPNEVPGWRGCCGLTGQFEGRLRFDLSDYAGMDNVGVRFTYATDWAVQERGWWVDDLSLDDATGNLYSNDLEDYADWTLDGWIEVPFTALYPRYYLVEWRNYSGFDEGLMYPYQTVWADEDEWEVDRAPYTAPGMLLWFRDTGYKFDYTLGDAWFDPPSWGSKYALLVVDSHPFPRMWAWKAFPEWPPEVGLNLSGRLQPGDATFTLQETTSFTLRRGFTWVDDALGYVPEIQETKTFEARPPVSAFNDYLGYYPGLWCCDLEGYLWWRDIDASAVLPARGDYTTKITWPDGSPAYELYGIDIGTVLGDGNPWTQGFGVNLEVVDQAEDGSWGLIRFYHRDVMMAEITPSADKVGYVDSLNRLGNYLGSDHMYGGLDTRPHKPRTLYPIFQFDLSSLPAGAKILAAEVDVVGRDDRYMDALGDGVWHLQLLDPGVDLSPLRYWDVHTAGVVANIPPKLSQPELTDFDLGAGVVNTFIFGEDQLAALQERLDATGLATFRIHPVLRRAYGRNIFEWYGAGEMSPVLRVIYQE